MTEVNATPITELPLEVVEAVVGEEPKAKPKAKPKKKAAPKKKRNVVTKADLEVKVEELTKQLDLAQNKSEILFSENMKLREKNQNIEAKFSMANGLLIETVQNAFNMYLLATKN